MLTDWLMVIITFVYVIATIAICHYNKKAANETKEQTEEMIRQFNLTNRPKITVYFDIIRSGLLCLVVENIGNELARDVTININQEFIDNIPEEFARNALDKLNKSKMNLASMQKFFICIGGQIKFNEIKRAVAKINIVYNDKYADEVVVDLSDYEYLLVYSSPEEDMAQHLKHIGEYQKKFFNNFGK